MADEAFLVSGQYLRLIADQLHGRGISVARWLAGGGLSEAHLRDPSLTLSFQAFRELVASALALTNEPALGLIVGNQLLATAHGILGYAVMNSETLRSAVATLERFLPLRIALIGIDHAVVRREFRLHFRERLPLGDIRRPVMEAIVLTTKNICDAMAMTPVISRVSFEVDAPEYESLARDLFKTEVKWGQSWTGFALPLELVDRPLAMADAAAFEEAARICQRELDKLVGGTSVAVRVRRLLLESQSGFPSLKTVARTLHLTPRTLHRRLVEEGTSFNQTLNDVRHKLAIEYLEAGRHTVQQIAYALGYTELANFRRAFKRWEGVAPSDYRNRR